jgi:hypothetical protein
LVGVVAAAWAGSACSSSDTSPSNAGGAAGSTVTGGSPGTGGTTDTGGSPGTGGTTDTGGSPGTGGTIVATGGSPGTGGTTDTGGSPGTGGTVIGTGGSVGTGGTVVTTGCTSAGVTVPFVVTDKYGIGANNGVWGDWGAANIQPCATRATPTSVGKCFTVTYTYDAATGSDCTGTALTAGGVACIFTSVLWHIPSPTFAPGFCIAAGATKVTFQAWGSGTVEFAAAGVKVPQLLTATPTPYSIDISTSGYASTAQEAGFTVSFTSANTGAIVNVDDIQWVP